jgi:hypothetical protein
VSVIDETTEVEETTEEKPSRGREIAAALTALGVTVVIGMIAGGVTKKVNAELTSRIKNEKKNEKETDN